MTYVKDDRRYMSHELRAQDDARYRGKVERAVPAVETCYCGKTVTASNGSPTGWTCPRDCEAHRAPDNARREALWAARRARR